MKRSFPAAAVLIVLSLFCLPAQAATFDFVGLAAGHEHGALSEMFTAGGFTLTASAYLLTAHPTNGGGNAFMYLDDVSGGPGGLGVCQALTAGNQCTPNDDDNVTQYEVLHLHFDQAVTITNITFSNGNHQDIYSGNFGIAIDPGSAPTMVGQFDTSNAAVASLNPVGWTGTDFYFIAPSSTGGPITDEGNIYISTVNVTRAPEPATLGLLALGAGLLLGGRRLALLRKA